MSDSAEVLFAILLLSLVVSQCGTCLNTDRIADQLEKAAQERAVDAGKP